jgi:hypothetical protein
VRFRRKRRGGEIGGGIDNASEKEGLTPLDASTAASGNGASKESSGKICAASESA